MDVSASYRKSTDPIAQSAVSGTRACIQFASDRAACVEHVGDDWVLEFERVDETITTATKINLSGAAFRAMVECIAAFQEVQQAKDTTHPSKQSIWHSPADIPEDNAECLIAWDIGHDDIAYLNAEFNVDGMGCNPDDSFVADSGMCYGLCEVIRWAYIRDLMEA